MIVEIAYTALIVDEYERAIAFYSGILGFNVVEDSLVQSGKRWVRLASPGGRGSEILLSRAVNEQQKSVIGNQAGGRVLFFLHTDDFQSDYELFKLRGVEFTEGPSTHSFGKVAVFKDLYGNRIDLIESARTNEEGNSDQDRNGL